MKIEELRQSVASMSPEQLQEHIARIRKGRRVPFREKKPKKAKPPLDLSNLTPEQAQQLLEELTCQ